LWSLPSPPPASVKINFTHCNSRRHLCTVGAYNCLVSVECNLFVRVEALKATSARRVYKVQSATRVARSILRFRSTSNCQICHTVEHLRRLVHHRASATQRRFKGRRLSIKVGGQGLQRHRCAPHNKSCSRSSEIGRFDEPYMTSY